MTPTKGGLGRKGRQWGYSLAGARLLSDGLLFCRRPRSSELPLSAHSVGQPGVPGQRLAVAEEDCSAERPEAGSPALADFPAQAGWLPDDSPALADIPARAGGLPADSPALAD